MLVTLNGKSVSRKSLAIKSYPKPFQNAFKSALRTGNEVFDEIDRLIEEYKARKLSFESSGEFPGVRIDQKDIPEEGILSYWDMLTPCLFMAAVNFKSDDSGIDTAAFQHFYFSNINDINVAKFLKLIPTNSSNWIGFAGLDLDSAKYGKTYLQSKINIILTSIGPRYEAQKIDSERPVIRDASNDWIISDIGHVGLNEEIFHRKVFWGLTKNVVIGFSLLIKPGSWRMPRKIIEANIITSNHGTYRLIY